MMIVRFFPFETGFPCCVMLRITSVEMTECGLSSLGEEPVFLPGSTHGQGNLTLFDKADSLDQRACPRHKTVPSTEDM